MVISVGWKKTFSELVPRYPGLFLTPAFTSFIFGPIELQSSGGDSFNHIRSGKFGLSFGLSCDFCRLWWYPPIVFDEPICNKAGSTLTSVK